MTREEWEKDFARCLGMWLNGEELPETDERGRALHDASFLVLFNAHHDLIDFKLPDPDGGTWRGEIDTSHGNGRGARRARRRPRDTYPAAGTLARRAAAGRTRATA